MEYELQFRIMINTELSRSELLTNIKKIFKDLIQDQEYSYILHGNRMEVLNNENFDSTMTDDPDDGFLYFRYLIGIYPIQDDVSLDNQIQLAKSLYNELRARNISAEIVADFEELL